MKKNYVLDTNILIHNPHCLKKFEENDIYIPSVVIEELDRLKKNPNDVGWAARKSINSIRDILKNNKQEGNDSSEASIGNGGTLHLYFRKNNCQYFPEGWDKTKPDNQILLTVMELSSALDNVILVSNDGNMQIKADMLDIPVQEYQNDRLDEDIEVYKGRKTLHISDEGLEMLAKEGEVSPSSLIEADETSPVGYKKYEEQLQTNEFVTVKTFTGSSLLSKFNGWNLVKLEFEKKKPFGLECRNSGQTYLKEALMSGHEKHPLTICCGPAGTGKTLFALGCGLEQVMENNAYRRVLLCRPNVTMDEEIGFLPGTEQEKISPLLRGAYDNLEILLGNEDDSPQMINDKIAEIFQRGYVTAQSVAYLRGRSITNTYIIIDEAQNCTPNQILSIITRAGEGSKIVIMGDPNQIDNIRLDRRNNGLVYALERMKGSNLCEIITFTEDECTRSPLAKEASAKLKKIC